MKVTEVGDTDGAGLFSSIAERSSSTSAAAKKRCCRNSLNGARRVIGVDIRTECLQTAKRKAEAAAVDAIYLYIDG
jgi:hypothetical protein